MKKLTLLCTLLAAGLLTLRAQAPLLPFQDTSLSINQRVDDLLGRLTLDEKMALMEHANPGVPRLGLKPYSWWNEALHGVGRNGYATVYPMPVALAATFDTRLVNEVYQEVAGEARYKYNQAQQASLYADYTGLTFFTPNINIFRDPRWGRGMETYGEDPCLTALMGLACVDGLQHSRHVADSRTHLTAAACLKHLAAHSGPEGLRHEFDSRVSTRDLFTTYLPAFEFIVKRSDVQQVMCGYNRLNGTPCCTSKELLVDLLRNEWHYDNLIVTDCWALNDCWERDTVIPRHKTHASAALAAADAFGSEVDLECGSGLNAIRTALDSGLIAPEKIDQHARRILRTLLRVAPEKSEWHGMNPLFNIYGGLSYEAASASLVLLKNNNRLLPIRTKDRKCRVFLAGPNAADTLMPLGNYNGTPYHAYSIEEGLSLLPDVEMAADAGQADIIIYAGGLNPQLEGEELPVDMPGFYKGDRTLIELPAQQANELRTLKESGRPVILVLSCGSAIALDGIADSVDAVIVAWYGGQDMGRAVADALFSRDGSDRFGRLPVTFYRSSAQLPDFGSYDMRGRTYRYMTDTPQYPFGFGLSYADFELGDSIGTSRNSDGTITFWGEVRSTHAPSATAVNSAVVQVYLHGQGEQGPTKSLVGFQKLSVKADGSARYRITIDPFWLRRYDERSEQMVLPKDGTALQFSIGLSSSDNTSQSVSITY